MLLPAISLPEFARCLYGGWRIFWRDPKGFDQFGTTLADFWKSFWCMFLLAPFYAYLLMLSPADQYAESGSWLRIGVVEVCTYLILWFIWPLMMVYLALWLEKFDGFMRYIIAYNWAAPSLFIFKILLATLAWSHVMPPGAVTAMFFGLLVYSFFYHVFIIRMTLQVDLMAAIGLVVGEFFLGLMVIEIRDVLLIG